MKSPQKNRNILQELERADVALTRILEKLRTFNDSLKPVELNLRVNDFSSKGVLRRGSVNGIICVLTASIKGDPLALSLEALEGKGHKLPSIIKSADRNESRDTCDSILKTIESLSQKSSTKFVVNLRWNTLPRNLNRGNIIVLGTRYYSLNDSDIQKIMAMFKSSGFEMLEDGGEYGGGLLVYSLLETLNKKDKTKIFELTLSKELAEDERKVSQILQVLSML